MDAASKKGYVRRAHFTMSKNLRIPLKGNLDLTYRCNNDCFHCWLRIPPNAEEKDKELPLDEIKRIVDEARAMGCREWSISGGEPMLRPDFAEIFDYIIRKAVKYTLNTNGTLITPQIAQLMKRKGAKLVALYGATAQVHDTITRTPGSFEAVMRGMAYLKEAGAGFIVQLIPMKANYHQWNKMIELAESLSPHWRCGAPWLHLSAYGDDERNRQITQQRLSPREVVKLDPPDVCYEEEKAAMNDDRDFRPSEDDRIFAPCIEARRDFHIDPYGKMSFCSFVKDPALRYDLRSGSFSDCWYNFIPSLKDKVRGGKEYLENCGSCELRSDCRWCGVYAYLEHGRYSAPIRYLCAVAKEAKRFKENWRKNHRRYYQIAGITVQVDSDLPITDTTFAPRLKVFEVDRPGEDVVKIRHHFKLPELDGKNLGEKVYKSPPWAVYKKWDTWIYLCIPPNGDENRSYRIAEISADHTKVRVYNPNEEHFAKGNLNSLTMFPTDQILLARVLADRKGIYLHAAGVVINGKGLLFVGDSGAGKSTIVKMLDNRAKILCDDRIIVRKWPGGFKIHGTWSHGEVPDVSPDSAPLHGIFFLRKANENCLEKLETKKMVIHGLLENLIKPLNSKDWWEKVLGVIKELVYNSSFYMLHFDKTGKVVKLLEELCYEK